MYAQIKSLLLMAVVLAAIIAYAFSPKEITLGSYTIRKITLTSIFLSAKEPQKEHKKKPKTIHRNQTILFIGDSMVEGLSRRLGDYAGENGHKLYTVIWYSSSTERWGTTHTLEHYIDKYKPTYILICLGSNELFINDLANRAQYVSEMVKKIGDIPFVWISPSDWNGDTGINDIIKERVGAGHFFDSRHLKLKRGSDHYHPTWEAAAYWMDTAAKFIASNECDNPLQLNSPKAHHKATNTSLLQPAFEGF